MLDDGLARLGQLAVAALFASHVDDDAARLHALHHLGGNQLGSRFARDQRGGDDDVAFLGLLGVHLALRGLKSFAHDFCVTSAARAFLLVVDLDELATQRLNLIGHFGTGIIGAHDGAQIGGSADRCEAGDARASDEDLGWRDFARGRHLAVEETAKSIGGFDDSSVATDAGSGRQRIHLLGA